MRFKAVLHNDRINLFSKLVSSVAKVGKECVVHLSPQKVLFIQSAPQAEASVQLWAFTEPALLFREYHVDSLAQNTIGFEVTIDVLERALRSTAGASNVIVKLTKKDNLPFFSIVIEQMLGQSMSITQDVPITLLTTTKLSEFVEPSLPDPDVLIMLPPLRILRPVVDKLKNLADSLEIAANMKGEMVFKVETDVVSVQTSYRNLQHPHYEGGERPPPEARSKAQVHVKKLLQVLAVERLNPSNVVMCLIENNAVVVHVLQPAEGLFLTYYLPTINTASD